MAQHTDAQKWQPQMKRIQRDTGVGVAAGVFSGPNWDICVPKDTRFQPMKSYLCVGPKLELKLSTWEGERGLLGLS